MLLPKAVMAIQGANMLDNSFKTSICSLKLNFEHF